MISYDVSTKAYIIKTVKSGIQHNILLESGVRQAVLGMIDFLESTQRTISMTKTVSPVALL